MLFECCAIILIILAMAVIVSREGRKNGWVAGILPLVIVPSGHILGILIGTHIGNMLGISNITAHIAVDIAALVVTCLLIGGISLQIKHRKKRIAYLVTCGLYSVLLTCVLMVRSIIA